MINKKDTLILILICIVILLVSYNFNSTTHHDKDEYLITDADLTKDTSFLNHNYDEDYLRIIEKAKRGEPLTNEEIDRIDQQRVLDLEKYDKRAAELERQLKNKGYLGTEDFDYLTTKEKELDKLYAIDLLKKHKKTNSPP